jgi:pyruvate dehydrogenase E2 component (dihydrolipoamide acetyltransferase)
MPVDVIMPKLGLTMASGTIARWIKRPGEAVREGEPLLEVSTDKISYEIESPASGTVARAVGNEGDEFACGDVIGLIALAGETETLQTTAKPPSNGARVVASPAARRLAREHNVALRGVRGTGPRGRITLGDISALRQAQDDNGGRHPAMGDPDGRDGAPDDRERDPKTTVILTLRRAQDDSKGGYPARLPAQRRTIYRKMTEVGVLPVPQVETVANVNALHALIARRGDFGWSAFAVYAAARLLRDHAEIRTDASTGTPFERIDIGVAADTPHGLIVPVVRSADVLPLAEIQREIVRLAKLARDGGLGPNDVGGACFSISNVGPQGVERVAPLPDPPQTAILGIGAATQRPAVVPSTGSGQAPTISAAWMLTCVLAFDHRFIDGAPAARFLAAFARACTDPGVLL